MRYLALWAELTLSAFQKLEGDRLCKMGGVLPKTPLDRLKARSGEALCRVQPVLRRQGLNIAFSREDKPGMRVIELSNR